MLSGKNVLLIISGGISAYKSLELIRLLTKDGATVRCILTKAGSEFVTPLSVSSLSGNKVYEDLWSLTDESEMGHIRLSRECDLIVVAPASADLIAKMANGMANDLASTTLLASNKPIMIAPAMNPQMWNNPATQANIDTLLSRNIEMIGPAQGDMACGEYGYGRMVEAPDIHKAILDYFFDMPLRGCSALVTAGPTFEPIDPVRFLGNRSSGLQGYEIAAALREAGALVTLVSGPTSLPDPVGVDIVRVETAARMLDACESVLPCDIAVFTAAVSDWRPETQAQQKIKKTSDASIPTLSLAENQDILKVISNHKKRPRLVIGFAAETENLEENAREKLDKKGCDWIMANTVGPDENGEEQAFGAQQNQIHFISKDFFELWPRTSKKDIAAHLVKKIIVFLKT